MKLTCFQSPESRSLYIRDRAIVSSQEAKHSIVLSIVKTIVETLPVLIASLNRGWRSAMDTKIYYIEHCVHVRSLYPRAYALRLTGCYH